MDGNQEAARTNFSQTCSAPRMLHTYDEKGPLELGPLFVKVAIRCYQPPLDGFELPFTPAELPGPVVLVPGIVEIAPVGL